MAAIPSKIIQYWDVESIPLDVADLMSSWAKVNPNFEHIVVTKALARDLIRQFPHKGVGEALEKCWHPAMEADVVRLFCLHEWGGIYIDADHEAVAPIGDILSEQVELLLTRRPNGVFTNSFIGARPRHPLIRRTLEVVVDNVNSSRGDENLWLVSGPGAFTPLATNHLLGPNEVVVSWDSLRQVQRVHNNLPYKVNHWSGVHPLQTKNSDKRGRS